jgi:hypothetical protein
MPSDRGLLRAALEPACVALTLGLCGALALGASAFSRVVANVFAKNAEHASLHKRPPPLRGARLGGPHGSGALPWPPGQLDFAYLSFTVGMTFQVSDVRCHQHGHAPHGAFSQAVLAFGYNTAVLRFWLQLIFGAL